METKYKNPPIEEEIDLTVLVWHVVLFFQKNIIRIIIFSTIGILLGIGAYYILPRTYKSRLIADSGTLPNAEIINIIEVWQSLINKNDYQTLASTLGIKYEVAAKIRNLEADNTEVPNQPQLPGKETNSFVINIIVSDAKVLKKLETAIIYSLENNNFIKTRIALKKGNLYALKKKISDEIADLEELKTSVQTLLKSTSSISGTFLTDPANINLQIITMYERVLAIDTEIKLLEDIQVIESFSVSEKHDNPKLLLCIITGLVAGLFFFIIVAILRFIRHKVATTAN